MKFSLSVRSQGTKSVNAELRCDDSIKGKLEFALDEFEVFVAVLSAGSLRRESSFEISFDGPKENDIK